jgi:dolichyl-phosphate beta-glucosyltransferase
LTPSLGIVIPAYNEEHRIGPTLRSIAAARTRLAARIVEIVIALNGTTDATDDVAMAVAAATGLPLTLYVCRDRGKASALAEAVPDLVRRRPDLDVVLLMDADNATDIAMLSRFDLTKRSIQIGSRVAPGSTITTPIPLSRRVMSAVMRTLTRRLFGLPVVDTQCGFKLFPADLAAALFSDLQERSWIFDVEILARAHAAGIPISEIPVVWTDVEGSKVRPIRDAIGSFVALIRLAVTLRRRPSARAT